MSLSHQLLISNLQCNKREVSYFQFKNLPKVAVAHLLSPLWRARLIALVAVGISRFFLSRRGSEPCWEIAETYFANSQGLDYEERLRESDFFSMSHWCLHGDLIPADHVRHQILDLRQSLLSRTPLRDALLGVSLSCFMFESLSCTSLWNRQCLFVKTVMKFLNNLNVYHCSCQNHSLSFACLSKLFVY